MLPDYVPGEEALLNKTYFTTIPTDEQKKSGVEPHTIASRMRPALLKEVREAEAYRVRSRVRDREFQGKPGRYARSRRVRGGTGNPVFL